MSVITQINLSLVFPPLGAGSILGGKVNVVQSYLLQAILPTRNSFAFVPRKEMCSAIVIRKMVKRSIQ